MERRMYCGNRSINVKKDSVCVEIQANETFKVETGMMKSESGARLLSIFSFL